MRGSEPPRDWPRSPQAGRSPSAAPTPRGDPAHAGRSSPRLTLSAPPAACARPVSADRARTPGPAGGPPPARARRPAQASQIGDQNRQRLVRLAPWRRRCAPRRRVEGRRPDAVDRVGREGDQSAPGKNLQGGGDGVGIVSLNDCAAMPCRPRIPCPGHGYARPDPARTSSESAGRLKEASSTRACLGRPDLQQDGCSFRRRRASWSSSRRRSSSPRPPPQAPDAARASAPRPLRGDVGEIGHNHRLQRVPTSGPGTGNRFDRAPGAVRRSPVPPKCRLREVGGYRTTAGKLQGQRDGQAAGTGAEIDAPPAERWRQAWRASSINSSVSGRGIRTAGETAKRRP